MLGLFATTSSMYARARVPSPSFSWSMARDNVTFPLSGSKSCSLNALHVNTMLILLHTYYITYMLTASVSLSVV